MARILPAYSLQTCCFAFLLVIFSFVCRVHCECNVCAVSSNLACVSETAFRMCTAGVMTGDILNCPAGYVCSLSGTCEPRGDSVIAPCAQCDQCDQTNTFACRNSRQFSLCLGTAQGSPIVGECKTGYVCDINYRYICAPIEDGYAPTCSPSIEVPTTVPPETTPAPTPPSPSEQPSNYCNYVQQRGRFPVGTDPTTTCRQYLLCIERNGTFVGALYYCPNGLFFDDTTRACTTSTPARCSGGVGSLSLFEFNLD